MTASPDAFLVSLPGLALIFTLILCRVSALVMIMPGLGEQGAPAMLRVGIALSLTLLLLPLLQGHFPAFSDGLSPIRLVSLIACEIFIGGLIGWLTRLVALILPIAGQILSLLVGLSSVLQPDPELGAETAILGRFFNLLAPVILLMTNAYLLPIRAVIGSYDLFPPDVLFSAASHPALVVDALQSVTRLTECAMLLSVELVAPFMLLSLLWQAALGIMSRLIPQLQIYNLAMPLQVLGGLSLVALLGRQMIAVWSHRAGDLLRLLPGL
ncbi:flagellar biosynthetic protein FliR [Kozakia baliensis]|uniref:flagellar biosynthetic protein FliR n=1 Tax=Kozakia baliensis TaxID=153496 RepID=UPI00087980CC|nr:flagellar biosynthetic protein FliR [Kozakia baliensis]AOX20972.1 hypothetical protein A0U90_12555 [Kozakia baliensis]